MRFQHNFTGADGESAQDPWADSPGLKVGKIVLKTHGSPECDCDSSGLAWGGAKNAKTILVSSGIISEKRKIKKECRKRKKVKVVLA